MPSININDNYEELDEQIEHFQKIKKHQKPKENVRTERPEVKKLSKTHDNKI